MRIWTVLLSVVLAVVPTANLAGSVSIASTRVDTLPDAQWRAERFGKFLMVYPTSIFSTGEGEIWFSFSDADGITQQRWLSRTFLRDSRVALASAGGASPLPGEGVETFLGARDREALAWLVEAGFLEAVQRDYVEGTGAFAPLQSGIDPCSAAVRGVKFAIYGAGVIACPIACVATTAVACVVCAAWIIGGAVELAQDEMECNAGEAPIPEPIGDESDEEECPCENTPCAWGTEPCCPGTPPPPCLNVP